MSMKTLVFAIACAVLGTLPVADAASNDQSRQDQTFVNAAARGGKWEVEMGKLAQENASSPDVKQFGAKMVTDHTRLNTELGSVATSIGLTVPTGAFQLPRGLQVLQVALPGSVETERRNLSNR